MTELATLRGLPSWRLAVWALRIGYVALMCSLVGLVVMSSGSAAWIVAIGVIVWLVAAAVTLAGVIQTRHQLAEPRPGYWSMRLILIHDTVHAKSSTHRT